jgi:hypothetical protein
MPGRTQTPPEGGAELHLSPLGASGTSGGARSGCSGQTAFTLGAFAGELTGAADGLGLLSRLLLGGLLVVVPELHLPENAFALQLLL